MIPLHDDNPTHIFPVVTVGLIVVCVLVFFWQLSLPGQASQQAVYSFGLIPAVLFGDARLPAELVAVPPALSVLTSMFLHGGWMHLIGNMLYLWIFGNNIEDSMGHARFIVFYVLCGVAAALTQALQDPASIIPITTAASRKRARTRPIRSIASASLRKEKTKNEILDSFRRHRLLAFDDRGVAIPWVSRGRRKRSAGS